ncbi:zinc finger protein 518B [Labrus bergylta]|uniref:zinc finger protein 518B n=1 Tax=Labrus bergylta TaxID=56723 RepID=UPI003313A5F8
MKPTSYQSTPPPVKVGHSSLALTTSNVMYCDKCGFATTDPAVFKKHRIEHMGMRFYCFYCNNVSFSEAELTAHVKLHTVKYQFQCPHCGQGYMRRLCLVKHIERLHSKSLSQGAAKPGSTKSPHAPLSSALPGVPTAVTSSLRPAVRVTVPRPSAPAVRPDEQRGRTLDHKTSSVMNSKTELLPPLNGLIQQSRALTVPLPEEVNIPADCLVELVEVRTVNGTKELKLRLVSQQENESVIKDTRTTVSANSAPGKPLSSSFNPPNTGKCSVNRKPYDMKDVNVAPPAVVNVYNNQQNHVSKEKNGLKRGSGEIIDLEGHAATPRKVSKSIFSSVKEGNSGIKVSAAPPTLTSTWTPNTLPSNLQTENTGAGVSQRADQRTSSVHQQSKSCQQQRGTRDLKSVPRDVQSGVKLEPGVRLNNITASIMKKEAGGSNQQDSKSSSPSVCVSSVSALKQKPPMISVCTGKGANECFSGLKASKGSSVVKTPALSNGTHPKVSTWTQEARLNNKNTERAEPEAESFPVISSVFSLSQQPEDVQGSIQPLVMAALRGIVMNNSSGAITRENNEITTSTDLVKELPALGCSAQVLKRDVSLSCVARHATESVKVEQLDKGIEAPPPLNHVDPIQVKEEESGTKPPDDHKQSQTPDVKPPTDQKPVSKVSVEAEPPLARSEHDVYSKFLTVSLQRVQVGEWKKNRKGLKLRLSKCKTRGAPGSPTDCSVIYPVPLKEDQPVKRPRPNQPVVVLNHPRPRASSAPAARAHTLSDTGASTGAPKCQILRMRLSKVMGQKYEVMGCTVGVFS